MGNYEDYSYEQKVFLPVSCTEQVLPGTFEYTLNYII